MDPDTSKFVDEHGRERFFHGVNIVYKSAPYIPKIDEFDPITSYSKEDMAILRKYGMNAVRLGVMWPGVEPQRGEYNTTYLDMMKDLVDWGEEYGISTMVDFHQDLLSEKFCGEGIPLWAVKG